MTAVYQIALASSFQSIMNEISKSVGYGSILNGLTEERRGIVQSLAEQAILDWTVQRQQRQIAKIALTNLERLLDEYCTLSERI